ncbi:Tyrosine--tRNA ligase [Psidium guajava]|nr:Tyrosine--tRNA ligase [Psidium guajava]
MKISPASAELFYGAKFAHCGGRIRGFRAQTPATMIGRRVPSLHKRMGVLLLVGLMRNGSRNCLVGEKHGTCGGLIHRRSESKCAVEEHHAAENLVRSNWCYKPRGSTAAAVGTPPASMGLDL